MKNLLLPATLIGVIACLLLQTKMHTVENKTVAPQTVVHFKTPPSLFYPVKKHQPAASPKDTTDLSKTNWYSNAIKNIAASEYEFKQDSITGNYSTPNRKNNLRFHYNENGFSAEPRTTKIPVGKKKQAIGPGAIKYRSVPNWKVKFNLDNKLLGKGKWEVNGNQANYITENITVQYINKEDGMRQNFIVKKSIPTNHELTIPFQIETTLKTTLHNNSIEFFHKKTNVLSYEQLKVWDASGKTLEASIDNKGGNQYAIHVKTNGAVYPITIDPLSTTPSLVLTGDQNGGEFGFAVAAAGDVNGDGYGDVIISAPDYNHGQISEGVAYIYYGAASGLSNTPASIVESNIIFAAMGYSVSTAGDINGDGYSDIILGAPFYTNGETKEGAAYIYYGSAAGINPNAPVILESNQPNAQMGVTVSTAGDINGDGYSDIVVGSHLYDDGQADIGAAFIYYGSAAGINTVPAAKLENGLTGSYFGYSVGCAGDVNGDGYSDVVIGAPYYSNGPGSEGAVYVFQGGPAGINTSPSFIAESFQANALMGVSVGGGDFNGDGYSDIMAGSYYYTKTVASEGAVLIYNGSPAGISGGPATILQSFQSNARFGESVGTGDFNGDGYCDVIVGAFTYSNGESFEGATYIYKGSPNGINTTPVAIFESNAVNAQLGYAANAAGDVNGDGYSDFIAGAPFYSNSTGRVGSAYLFYGSPDGINPNTITSVIAGAQLNEALGTSVSSAGDVNGDGFSDVVIGAPLYDNGQTDEGAAFIYLGSANGIVTPFATKVESNQVGAQMGYSVASAGDVNGDGYSDVIVGAPQYHNGSSAEGAVFLFLGSPTGTSTTVTARVESNINFAQLGFSVAAAGDVNGDGYADIIAGANLYTNGQFNEGAAYVYLGTATGINTIPSAILQSNQANAQMGYSVGTAGDVNGDGFSDIIVGAPFFDNGQTDEGTAFIYYGSVTGINTVPAVMLESNQANAQFGTSVATAGDVNGDGYSDVIVGAPFYTNGQTNEGVAFIYQGSATGTGTLPVIMLESNQANAQFGISVATAGDVNGDGYSDVIVGANMYTNGETQEGAIYVYHGSPAGLAATAALLMESNTVQAQLGTSVAGAGDINGDGFSDIIAGAPGYSNIPGNFTGGAFTYYGGSTGIGKQNNLRLYNSDLSTIINHSNVADIYFGAGLFAKSFLGRQKGKMVWETRISYAPFSGAPITNSVLFTSRQMAYTDLGISGTELKSVITKLNGARFTKVRARVKYDMIKAFTGQPYGPWRYVPAQLATTQLGILPLDIISFKAAWLQKGKTAVINFITDNERNNCCFEIEKSTDGMHYSSIGNIPARNLNGRQNYSYTDSNAAAANQYYRLKMIGIDGQYTYSTIMQLQSGGATEIMIFPNPATDNMQIQLNKMYDKISMRMINNAGQVVKQSNYVLAGIKSININVSNLSAGTYWIYLEAGADRQVLQFVKD